jgi:uncharacterized membrane protein
MTARLFSTKAALSFGWAKMIDHLNIFLPLCLLSWVASALQAAINRWHGAATVMRWLVAPILLLVTVQLLISWVRAILKVQDGRAPTVAELSHVDLTEFFQYLLGSLLYGLVVAAGMVLLVVPGVLWAIKYCFTGFLIIDLGLDPLTAMRRSAELTRPARGQLFFFGLTLLGVNILGALVLGIGLLATVPMTVLALGQVYRQLLQNEHTSHAAQGEHGPPVLA